jgi:hypothetical protein
MKGSERWQPRSDSYLIDADQLSKGEHVLEQQCRDLLGLDSHRAVTIGTGR